MFAHCFCLHQLLSNPDQHFMGYRGINHCNPELAENFKGVILLFCGHSFGQRLSNPRNTFRRTDFKLRVFHDLSILVNKADVLEEEIYHAVNGHWAFGGCSIRNCHFFACHGPMRISFGYCIISFSVSCVFRAEGSFLSYKCQSNSPTRIILLSFIGVGGKWQEPAKIYLGFLPPGSDHYLFFFFSNHFSYSKIVSGKYRSLSTLQWYSFLWELCCFPVIYFF